ncbi:MAG: hypothetical protein JNL54_03410 [Kineosporiaceae bacterium]|nr:hypothetical protein [Kineosporiaceae bacterium]
MATKKAQRKRPGKLRRKLYQIVWNGAAQIAKDRERKKAQGAGVAGGGQSSGGGRGRSVPAPRRSDSAWTRPDNAGPGAAIPAMPEDYTATGWNGQPVTDPAALRFFWARENGYNGPIDQDGHPTDDQDEDRSGDLEWADDDQDDDQGGDQLAGQHAGQDDDGQAGETR